MRIRYEPRPGYLYVRVDGDFDFHQARDSLPEAFRECIRHELDKVLVDLRELRGENTRIGRYFYLEAVGELHDQYARANNPPISVVYVGSNAFVSTEGYEERVAQRYTYSIKTTADIDEGLRWLSDRGS